MPLVIPDPSLPQSYQFLQPFADHLKATLLETMEKTNMGQSDLEDYLYEIASLSPSAEDLGCLLKAIPPAAALSQLARQDVLLTIISFMLLMQKYPY